MGSAPGGAGGHRQDGHQIGDLLCVDGFGPVKIAALGQNTAVLPLHAAPHGPQYLNDGPVPLTAVPLEGAALGPAPQQPRHSKEGGMGIIPLHYHLSGGIPLSAGHEERVLPLPAGVNAKGLHGCQREVHISPGLKGGRKDDSGVPVPQGQSEEQPRDKLGGHIPRQGKNAAGQFPLNPEHTPFEAPLHAQLPADGLIWAKGPLHEPPPPGEIALHAIQRKRDQEPQCAARFPALHSAAVLELPPPSSREDALALLQPGEAQGPQGPQRGMDIVASAQVINLGAVARQCGANGHTVPGALGGLYGNPARQGPGLDTH